jgi:hypothetical protein
MLYEYVPAAVGAPLIVMMLLAQVADTPAGKPVAGPIPVAIVVVCVIFVNTVLTQTVGVDEAGPAVLIGNTTIVPVAFTAPQPFANGML